MSDAQEMVGCFCGAPGISKQHIFNGDVAACFAERCEGAKEMCPELCSKARTARKENKTHSSEILTSNVAVCH